MQRSKFLAGLLSVLLVMGQWSTLGHAVTHLHPVKQQSAPNAHCHALSSVRVTIEEARHCLHDYLQASQKSTDEADEELRHCLLFHLHINQQLASVATALPVTSPDLRLVLHDSSVWRSHTPLLHSDNFIRVPPVHS